MGRHPCRPIGLRREQARFQIAATIACATVIHAVVAVVAAPFTGAALAVGVMWHMMVFDGFDYTRESWHAIPALWGHVPFALCVALNQRLVGGVALLLSAYLASTYFAGPYGYVPGAVIAVVALNIMRTEGLRWIDGRVRVDTGSERV